MGRYIGGVAITGYIAPTDTLDIYATHKASLGNGGYRSTLDIATRDAITDPRREEGMIVYVISENKEYRLVNGITNAHWVEINETQLIHNDYIIVADITARDDLDVVERKLGLLVYCIAEDTEYRLFGGITNADWKIAQVAPTNLVSDYIIVDSIVDRNTISVNNRKIGLLVYVVDENKEYRLLNGITNADWVEITGTSSTGSCCNYVIVEKLYDIENYPMDKRFVGLTIYSTDSDKEFRFVNGITNADLKEINSTLVNYNPIEQIVNSITQNVDGTTEVTQNININNNYWNTIGCLDKSNIINILLGLGGNLNPVYVDGSGNTVLSKLDKNEFSFKINSSNFWVDDWVLFEGSTKITYNVVSEIFMEITLNGSVEIFNISNILKGLDPLPTYLKLFGSLGKWYGFIKGTTIGRRDFKVYQTEDMIQSTVLNKTIYFFAPNFAIYDGTSNLPLSIKVQSLGLTKDYEFKVLPNTNLNVNLVRIQVNGNGIDTTNYTIIPGTYKQVIADSTYSIPKAILEPIPDGNYALIITGVDNGISIPPYFYGPFTLIHSVIGAITPII